MRLTFSLLNRKNLAAIFTAENQDWLAETLSLITARQSALMSLNP